jgi:hypothetical protein
MTAGRLGKEQRAEARLLFFVLFGMYIRSSHRNGGDYLTPSLSVLRSVPKLFARVDFRYNTLIDFNGVQPRRRSYHGSGFSVYS